MKASCTIFARSAGMLGGAMKGRPKSIGEEEFDRLPSTSRHMSEAPGNPAMIFTAGAARTRKATLASLLRKHTAGVRLCEHIEADGELVFQHACKMGLEGIVSKRRDSRYSSGISPHWIKNKNPASVAVSREASEKWN